MREEDELGDNEPGGDAGKEMESEIKIKKKEKKEKEKQEKRKPRGQKRRKKEKKKRTYQGWSQGKEEGNWLFEDGERWKRGASCIGTRLLRR
jgi:hypothetical protein